MEEKKNKSSIFVIIILAIVTLLLSFFIWNLEKQVLKISDENRKLQEEISKKDVAGNDACILENLNGEILNFPVSNDSDVIKISNGYKYNNYSIEYYRSLDDYGAEYYQLTVKDKNGKTVYSNPAVKNSIDSASCTNNDGKSIDTTPVISNGKLHFVAISNKCYVYDTDELGNENKWPYYEYSSIDLTTSSIEVKSIQLLKLMMEGADISDVVPCK